MCFPPLLDVGVGAVPSSACPAVAKVLPPYSTPVDNMYVELKSNVLTRGFVACGDYFYYYINGRSTIVPNSLT